MLESIKYLSGMGQNVCGSVLEYKAAKWVESQIEDAGLNTSLEQFKVVSWDCKRIEIRVLSLEKKDLQCVAFGYSPSTPSNGLRAEVVVMRDCLDSDVHTYMF